jgi:Cu-processing system permease protein
LIRITKYVLLDILKNRVLVLYTLLIALLSWTSFNLEDNSSKGLLTLLNVILLTVPLVSVLFSTIYIYNSSEFIELMLSQPVPRKTIWFSLFSGLSVSLVFSFLLGAGIPLLIYAETEKATMMILIGILITLIFVSIAFLSSILFRDKAKGIGMSVLLWLYFAFLFDGIVLFLMFQFSDYPIEKIMVAITALSPVDLSRIMMLMQLDISAMMGYTGAIFKDFFGTGFGLLLTFLLLVAWIVFPFTFSLFKFNHKDL